MEKITVDVVKQNNFKLPEYQTTDSTCVDLQANISESIILNPMERALIPTGLFVQPPPGYNFKIYSRSGLSFKQALVVLNAPGIIDRDYIGELKVVLINLSETPQIINPGDRIAQMECQKFEQLKWNEVLKLSNTDRGNGGFGSTGK